MSYYARKKILHGVSGELRITRVLPILGGHRVALGCSALHANGCFNACRNFPMPKKGVTIQNINISILNSRYLESIPIFKIEYQHITYSHAYLYDVRLKTRPFSAARVYFDAYACTFTEYSIGTRYFRYWV